MDSRAKNNKFLQKYVKSSLIIIKIYNYVKLVVFLNLAVKEHRDLDLGTQFNADPDPQSGGEAIIRNMKNRKSIKRLRF